jgi:hypothetical protein
MKIPTDVLYYNIQILQLKHYHTEVLRRFMGHSQELYMNIRTKSNYKYLK